MPLHRLHHLWRYFKLAALQRRLPHGLLGPAYLWPGGDARIRLHRRFWWQSGRRLPRPLWLALEFSLWLRWLLWHAVPACRRALRRHGLTVEAQEGIPRRTQTLRVLKLALLWCIPPVDSYRFRLYREPGKALDYVYDSEGGAYHSWRSEALGCHPASLRLLQDKARLAAHLARHDVPVVTDCAVVPGHDEGGALARCLAQHGKVFCKMNGGNQGRGAFSVWQTEDGLAGRAFTGQSLPDTRAVETAWRELLALGPAVIQPCLMNHPDLAPLAWNDDAITVRFISQWEEEKSANAPARLSCLSAILEVPAGQGDGARIYYAMLPIQPDTGALSAPIEPPSAEPVVLDALARVANAARTQALVPDWHRLAEASFTAHGLFPDLRTIAWDWVLTPDGPRLLEGNTGWGTATLQVLHGGLLADFGGSRRVGARGL